LILGRDRHVDVGAQIANAMSFPPIMINQIYRWMQNKFPETTDWVHEDFHCFDGAPAEFRWLLFTNKFEFEIQNGLLPQLLWNTIFHWRLLFSVSRQAYEHFELIPEANALSDFQILFEKHEKTCLFEFRKSLETQEFQFFVDWCDSMSEEMTDPKVKLFLTTPEFAK